MIEIDALSFYKAYEKNQPFIYTYIINSSRVDTYGRVRDY